jgi:hypothetical protein
LLCCAVLTEDTAFQKCFSVQRMQLCSGKYMRKLLCEQIARLERTQVDGEGKRGCGFI